MREQLLYLCGEWRPGKAGKFKPVINPATEQEVARVACADSQDLEQALSAAEQSAAKWRDTPAEERGRMLRVAADILRSRVDTASAIFSEEQGKTVAQARGEFLRAIDTLVWNGNQAAVLSAPVPAGDGARAVMPEPAGVVAAFVPWNFPAVITARKLGPALAAGCPVILKAPEEAPSAATTIVGCLAEAGIPSGVLNLVFGDPPAISAQLLASPIVRVVSFTGSTAVGRQLAGRATDQLQRCVLELGGHAPVLVFADADLDAAARAIADYKFACAGQSCNAPSRIFVQSAVYDAFVQRLTAIAESIQVGPGNDPTTQMGPMANPRRLEVMERMTSDATRRGATVATGGSRPKRTGYYWLPTILRDVPDNAAIMQEEPFGPILPIAPFATVEEAVLKANATRYGLAAYVFTGSAQLSEELASRLVAGHVAINHLQGVPPDFPIAGINDSGYGYEGGVEGFRSFQSLKLISRKKGG
jgi:succinate-semialdehyde dehydrogenase / glutarate-semialdehyde dehydrogenase